jgi:hypothetical protein
MEMCGSCLKSGGASIRTGAALRLITELDDQVMDPAAHVEGQRKPRYCNLTRPRWAVRSDRCVAYKNGPAKMRALFVSPLAGRWKDALAAGQRLRSIGSAKIQCVAATIGRVVQRGCGVDQWHETFSGVDQCS